MGVDKEVSNYSVQICRRPPLRKRGDVIAYIPEKMVRTRHELALTLQLICDRRLFGSVYQRLKADCFDNFSSKSGVMICPVVPIRNLIASASFPGDIDLLVIPFDGSQLLISDTLAIEIKIVRASFLKQGKAPNDYGFSQSLGLLSHGFPFVAVVHLIVSDCSPEEAWVPGLHGVVIDAERGILSELVPGQYDPIPATLVDRCFGRLLKNTPDNRLGLAAAYLEEDLWRRPLGKESIRNQRVSVELFKSLANYYQENSDYFLETTKC